RGRGSSRRAWWGFSTRRAGWRGWCATTCTRGGAVRPSTTRSTGSTSRQTTWRECALCVSPSAEQLLRNVAAVVRDLLEHGLVQPHVHGGRVAHLVRRTAELGRQLLTRPEAAVEAEKLQKVDDRDLPVELLGIGGGELLELGDDVDHGDRRRGGRLGRGRGSWRGLHRALCSGGRAGLWRRSRLRGTGPEAELFHDLAEQAHRDLLS